MKIKIPYELKLKFLSEEGLTVSFDSEIIDCNGVRTAIPFGPVNYQIKLILSDEPHLIEFCNDWIDKIQKYFKSSYKTFKVNIGSYEGLWPVEMVDGVVIFRIDTYNKERRDWKEWFIKEDGECTLAVY